MLLHMLSESKIHECYYTVENVIFECCSDDLVMCENLVIVPLYSFAGSRCVVDDVGSV